jgi:hypothetical protein
MLAPATAPPAPPDEVARAQRAGAVPSATALLRAWETCSDQPPLWRTLTLLRAGRPDATVEELAELPIGRRDAALLDLRERLFGAELICLADCPGCAEVQELRFRTADVRVAEPAPEERPTVSSAGWTVEFRLPTTADVAAVTEPADASDEPAGALLRRCTSAVRRAGREVPADRLPGRVRDAVARRMAELDPQAEIDLALTCPACARDWSVLFDIGEHLWQEVDGWARRLLLDVHTLASAYGWTEPDVLALSAQRRRFYLEAVGT